MAKVDYPHPISGKVDDSVRELMDNAIARFGATDSALIRMALESWLPGYIAAHARTEHLELFAKVGAAIRQRPELATEIEKLTRSTLRKPAKALAA
jgi:hypothetical protein